MAEQHNKFDGIWSCSLSGGGRRRGSDGFWFDGTLDVVYIANTGRYEARLSGKRMICQTLVKHKIKLNGKISNIGSFGSVFTVRLSSGPISFINGKNVCQWNNVSTSRLLELRALMLQIKTTTAQPQAAGLTAGPPRAALAPPVADLAPPMTTLAPQMAALAPAIIAPAVTWQLAAQTVPPTMGLPQQLLLTLPRPTALPAAATVAVAVAALSASTAASSATTTMAHQAAPAAAAAQTTAVQGAPTASTSSAGIGVPFGSIPPAAYLASGISGTKGVCCASSMTSPILLRSLLRSQSVDFTNENLPDCCICLTEPVQVIVRPCSHICLCSQCANDLENGNNFPQCPICRRYIRETARFYFA